MSALIAHWAKTHKGLNWTSNVIFLSFKSEMNRFCVLSDQHTSSRIITTREEKLVSPCNIPWRMLRLCLRDRFLPWTRLLWRLIRKSLWPQWIGRLGKCGTLDWWRRLGSISCTLLLRLLDRMSLQELGILLLASLLGKCRWRLAGLRRELTRMN